MSDALEIKEYVRFRRTEERVRRNDPIDNVEWIHRLEDEVACLQEAVLGRDETIMHILKREERLRKALEGFAVLRMNATGEEVMEYVNDAARRALETDDG